MKKIFLFLAIAVLFLSFPVGVMAQSPAPGGPWSSAFRVQNMGSDTALCTYEFFDTSGTAAFTSSQSSINVGDSLYVYVPDLSALATGTFSGVVSCDQPVGAVVNFSDPDSGASFSGISKESTTWYAPGIYDNFYNYYSKIFAQNTTSNPINATLEIFAPGNPTPVYSNTKSSIPAFTTVNWEQEGLAELNNNVAYSAKVTATGNIAPVVNIYGLGAVANQLYSYNPFPSGSTVAYTPVILNGYYGNNSSLVIQNISNSTASVTVEYSGGYSKDYTINSYSATSIYIPGETSLPSGNINGLFAAKITSDQPIVSMVNESNIYNRAATYTGFASGSDTVVAPIVMKRYYHYNTSVTCQNIGTAPSTLTLTYGGVAGSVSSPSPVAVGATYMFYQPSDSIIPNGFIGSATIQASGGQSIVCVVNEDQNESPYGTQIMDLQYAYEGINN